MAVDQDLGGQYRSEMTARLNPSPKVITGALHPDNKEACDWGFQGFIAYGCYGYIVIVDPNTIQVIQTLGIHKSNVCQVRWARENYHHAFATGSTYSLYLASADTTGNIIIWDVTNGQSRTEFDAVKETKPVSCMEWYTGYDESHDLLAVLRSPDILELWDGYSGVRLWRKVFGEPIQSMAFNPFDISSLVLLCDASKVLVISDFKPVSAPGDDFKVIQFVDSTPAKRAASPTRRASSSSLRHSRSWSKVVSLAITIPSGLLGTSDATKKRHSVSSDDDSECLTRCLQMTFNPAHRHQLLLLFEREILILDVDLDLSIGTIHLDKSSPGFVKIFPCRWTDVLYCLHDNGSISTRIKRKGPADTPSSDTLIEHPSNKGKLVPMEMTYDLCCQSDPIRLLRNSKVFTSVYNPVTERTAGILLSDSRLILWDVLSTELKATSDKTSKPQYVLPDLIGEPPELSEEEKRKNKGRKHLRMVATGLHGGIMSPITAVGMLRSLINSTEKEKLIALGTDAGVIQLVNVYSGQIEKEFKLFMSPVKGLDCIDNDSILAFSYSVAGPYGNKAVKNDILILHTQTGELTDFREKNERRGAIVDVKVSPSRLFATVLYKDWPIELWNIPNRRLMFNIEYDPNFCPTAMTWYPYYQKNKSSEGQPVTTEQLFIGSLHEHGNLLRVNVIDEKLDGLVRLSLTERFSTKSVTLGEIVCMAWKEKLFIFADRTGQLFYSHADKKSTTKKIYERLGFKFKSVSFAPGLKNYKFLVVFDDRVDTWEINTLGMEEMISSSPKFSASVLDGCWVGPDTAAVATAEGCLHIMAAISRRPADKKMEDGFVYIPDSSMKRMKNHIKDWEVPEPVFSPALLESKTAFLMKYILQCGLVSEIGTVKDHCHSAAVASHLDLIDRDILDYVLSPDVSLPDRCLMVARLFGDEYDTEFWRLAQYQLGTGKLDKSLELASGFLKTKKFGISEWFSYLTSPLSPKTENLMDFGTSEGQSQGEEINDLDISWVRDMDKVQPLETCFDLMMDEKNYKAYQLSRLCLHNKKRGNYIEKRQCASRFIMLGVDDMAVQTLMETEADREEFQNDCLKACLVSSLQSSSTSISTVKLAATQLIAAGKLSAGIELLCLIKKQLDACKYYMSSGLWHEAVWLAKLSLPKEEGLPVMYRWADLLWSSNEKNKTVLLMSLGLYTIVVLMLSELKEYDRNKAVLLMLSLGQYTTVVLMLSELKQFDRAALFLRACLKNKLLEKKSETGACIEQIFLDFAKLLAVTRYKTAVEFYCDQSGQKGVNFQEDLKKMVTWS